MRREGPERGFEGNLMGGSGASRVLTCLRLFTRRDHHGYPLCVIGILRVVYVPQLYTYLSAFVRVSNGSTVHFFADCCFFGVHLSTGMLSFVTRIKELRDHFWLGRRISNRMRFQVRDPAQGYLLFSYSAL